jgi:hypothetical protein
LRPRLQRCVLAGLITASIGAAPVFGSAQNTEDKAKTLTAARARYYNLRRLGLLDVHAALQPNWDVLLAGTSAAEKAKTTLNNLRFWISIDATGQFRLSHDAKSLQANQVDYVEKIFKDVNTSVGGFFRTWSIFLLGSPFPDTETNCAIDRLASGYRFSQRQGELDVAIETDNEFAIIEIRVTGADRTSSLKPVLENTLTGLILRGYSASSHRTDGVYTNVTAELEYETVDGLNLLHKVNLNTISQGSSANFEWSFSDYQIKKREDN